MSVISINDLSFKYGDKEILKDINFKVKVPSLISFIAPNNGGKTTFIKCLSGVVPTDGEISIDEDTLNKKTIRKYSRSIGTIFSLDNKQFLFGKVIDEVSFPLYNLNYSKKKIKQQVNKIKKLLFLQDILNKSISDLTEFEKIKVLLATTIIYEPKVLLLDDILTTLSTEDKERVLLMLRKIIKELKLIVIMTTSDLEEAIYSDALLILNEGTIVYSGRLKDILEHDNTLTRIGIEIPVMMDMSLKLKFYNLLDKVILNEEEMVDTLWD